MAPERQKWEHHFRTYVGDAHCTETQSVPLRRGDEQTKMKNL